jgi:hypothetical protein
VADDAVLADSCVFTSGLVRRSLSALELPPVSRAAGHCLLLFRSARGAEAKAPLGYGLVWIFLLSGIFSLGRGLDFSLSGSCLIDVTQLSPIQFNCKNFALKIFNLLNGNVFHRRSFCAFSFSS